MSLCAPFVSASTNPGLGDRCASRIKSLIGLFGKRLGSPADGQGIAPRLEAMASGQGIFIHPLRQQVLHEATCRTRSMIVPSR